MSKLKWFIILGIVGLLLIICPIIICCCKDWLKQIDDCCKLLFVILLVLIFIIFVVMIFFAWRDFFINKLIDCSILKLDDEKINEVEVTIKDKQYVYIKRELKKDKYGSVKIRVLSKKVNSKDDNTEINTLNNSKEINVKK